MGDVGAVATLLNTVAKWWMKPSGYEAWQVNRQVNYWNKEFRNAMGKRPRDKVRADNALAELRRLCRDSA